MKDTRNMTSSMSDAGMVRRIEEVNPRGAYWDVALFCTLLVVIVLALMNAQV